MLQRSASVPDVLPDGAIQDPPHFKRLPSRNGGYGPPRVPSAKSHDGVRERRMSVEDFLSPNVTSINDPPPSPSAGSSLCSDNSTFDDYELRLEVFSATELSAPEYRMGDNLRCLVAGEESVLCEVYIEVEISGRAVRTASTARMDKDEDRSAFFDKEKMLLTYKGETHLNVRVRNRRHLGAVVRGDPLIGEGQLSLGSELKDGQPKKYVVPIAREGKSSGFVSLQCQVFSASWEAARAYRAHVDDEVSALREVQDASDDTENFFENLKLSSESFNQACCSETFQKELAAQF